MNSLVASVAWDEARFDLHWIWTASAIVAVDDFNMGAMENKGLNLFNSKYVLASRCHGHRHRLRRHRVGRGASE